MGTLPDLGPYEMLARMIRAAHPPRGIAMLDFSPVVFSAPPGRATYKKTSIRKKTLDYPREEP